MPSDRPNVLLIQSDQHNPRFLGHVPEEDGGEPVETPALDDLAGSSTVFENAYCQMPVCGPSRMSMLTGREAGRCGAWSNGSVLDPSIPTIPEVFSAAGYDTALVGKMHFGGNHQFHGFDNRPYGDLTGVAGHQREPTWLRNDGAPLEEPYRHGLRNAGLTRIPESQLQERIVVEESTTHLREHRHENPDQPWFLCASFSRPHTPFSAPRRHFERYREEGVPEPRIGREGDAADHPYTEMWLEDHTDTFEVAVDERGQVSPEERQWARAGYFACVSFLDEIIGDFLATLDREGFLDNTIVVYTSDHGEFAGEHGLWFKNHWHEDAIRVPLFVETPAHREGAADPERLSTPVGLVDLFPTLCGLAEVDPPEGLDGESLAPAIRTGTEPDRGPVVCDRLYPGGRGGSEFRAVRDGRYKYVRFRDMPDLLFDLEADPRERDNLLDDGDVREVRDDLSAFVDETLDFDAAVEQRERDEARLDEEALPLSDDEVWDGKNSYVIPDAGVLGTGHLLNDPSMVTEDPEAVFGDWPDED